jgi:putative oxidoreductase
MSATWNVIPDPTLLASARRVGLDAGLLVARLWAGGLMLVGHGLPKLTANIASPAEFKLDPLGIGAVPSFLGVVGAEVIAAGLIVLGLGTRLATLPLIFVMVVAAFVFHAGDAFFLPGKAKEPAVMYGLAYVAILLAGPGRFSLDHLLARRVGLAPAGQ